MFIINIRDMEHVSCAYPPALSSLSYMNRGPQAERDATKQVSRRHGRSWGRGAVVPASLCSNSKNNPSLVRGPPQGSPLERDIKHGSSQPSKPVPVWRWVGTRAILQYRLLYRTKRLNTEEAGWPPSWRQVYGCGVGVHRCCWDMRHTQLDGFVRWGFLGRRGLRQRFQYVLWDRMLGLLYYVAVSWW